MSDTPPYSEATVELVTDATEQHYLSDGQTDAMGNSACSCGQWWDAAGDNPGWDQHMAEVALGALAAAGRLLPEGAPTAAEALMAAREDLNGVAKRLRAKAVETGDKEHFGLQAAGVQLACFRLVELADKAGQSAVPPEPKEGT